MLMIKRIILISISIYTFFSVIAQQAPSPEENIPFLVTMGKDADSSWGDEDKLQVFFFLVPADYSEPIYLRVFDPDIGGQFDELNEAFNTRTRFSIYGGEQTWTHPLIQEGKSYGEVESGTLLASKIFGNDAKYDNDYYTFGPFNPFEGEYVEKFDGRIFKIVSEGLEGNDGNLYRYFLSSSPNKNLPIEGANIFTYKYTFRLHNDQNQISQIYPFIDDKTTSIEISNFDWDNDGFIRIFSISKNGITAPVSGDNKWSTSRFPITEEERNTTIEVQFIKDKKRKINNNNVVIIVKNQYGHNLPFFASPLGGIPIYIPKIKINKVQ